FNLIEKGILTVIVIYLAAVILFSAGNLFSLHRRRFGFHSIRRSSSRLSFTVFRRPVFCFPSQLYPLIRKMASSSSLDEELNDDVSVPGRLPGSVFVLIVPVILLGFNLYLYDLFLIEEHLVLWVPFYCFHSHCSCDFCRV
ncbi:hypothetical protein LINGRAHAP2_LOCUS16092, partial [Linum grandiflorum]